MMSRIRFLTVVCFGVAVAPVQAQSPGWGSGFDRTYAARDTQGYNAPQRPPSFANANPRCRDLEFQLSGGLSQNFGAQDQLPRIDADMRQADSQYHRAESDAERTACYEDMFLFGRSLKRTPRCIDLDRQVQDAKARLAQLRMQRDVLVRGNGPRGGRRDEIVAELARNRCGDNYAREYEAQRSRSSSIFSFFTDEDTDDQNRYASQPPAYSTASGYQTKCVRLCDGFYFPISYSTGESHFGEDQAKCQSQCAAPSELYVHRVDQDVEQMATQDGKPYSQLPNAFRNRKVYLRGCSCNAAEYSREEIAKSEEALRTSKRADASAGKTATDAAPPANPHPAASPPVAAAPPAAAETAAPKP